MSELPRQSNVRTFTVPFAYALGLIAGVGVAKIVEHDGVDVVELRNGQQIEHWHADNNWRVVPGA